MEERLQKIMARAGFGSRRACEEFITTGRVTVNGQPAELGMKADPAKDRIVVDGAPLQYSEPEKVYIMLNKPRFVLSDRGDDEPRRTVFSLVPNSDGLFVVGRLDLESEGLMLLTNDGDLAEKLTHPRYGKEKEYQVLVSKRPDDKQLKAWRHGVVLESGDKTGPAQVVVTSVNGKGAWLRVIMTEGRKRQIREIGKTIGLPIVRLVRVRIGNLELGDLHPGEYRPLTEKQVANLRALVNGKEKKTVDSESNTAAPKKEYRGSKPYSKSYGQSNGKPFRHPARTESEGETSENDRKGSKPFGQSNGKPYRRPARAESEGETSENDRKGSKPFGKSNGKPFRRSDNDDKSSRSDRPFRKPADKKPVKKKVM